MRTTERITERIRPVALASESVRNLPVVLISLFIAIAGVDILLVTQPAFVTSLRDGWQGWMKGGVEAPWATVLGAAASVACVAVAAAVLTVVVRGIVEQPYLWLASALVAGCCFAMVRMNVEVPLRLPTPVFACMSAVLLVGGGAFLQGRSVLFNITGIFLLAVPLALLAIGYTQGQTTAGAAYSLDHNARWLLGTLSIASAGTLVIALAARRLRALGGSGALGTPTAEQLAELIERARAGELRAAEAEYRLHLMHERGAPLVDDEYELLRSRGSGVRRFAWWTMAAFAMGGAGFAFFAGYLPLQRQLASQQKINHTLTEQHAAAIVKLRAEVDSEREALRQTVRAQEPVPPPAAVAAEVAPTAAVVAPRAEAKGSSEPRKLEPAVRKTKPAEHSPAAPSTPAATKPQRAAEKTSQEPARQNHSPVAKSDDPLEGLDGM